MGTPRSPPTRLTVVPDKWSGLPKDPPTYQWAQRPSWQPTRPLEDLPEDSPDDLIHHDLKTRHTRQDLGGFFPTQIDGIWQDV
jgi:hypothetical protein